MPGAKGKLTESEVHGVLSNERRRLALEMLDGNGGEMSIRELSENIAQIETGEDPPPRNIRQSVYVSLHQTHLPKLDKLGIVDYDSSSKQTTLRDSVNEVAIYMEDVPKYGLSWSEYYVGVSVTGMLTLAASQLGVPILYTFPSWGIGCFFLLVICVSGIYQTYQQGSSIIYRSKE